MSASVEAVIAADQIGLDFHLCSPLDNWSVYEVLTDGLIAVKAERRDALHRHDHAAAGRALDEIKDLTCMAAACAHGLALQRQRFLRSGAAWPLGGEVP